MMIDLDNIRACRKCGVLFDFTLIGEKGHETDFQNTVFYKGQCPVCGHPFQTL